MSGSSNSSSNEGQGRPQITEADWNQYWAYLSQVVANTVSPILNETMSQLIKTLDAMNRNMNMMVDELKRLRTESMVSPRARKTVTQLEAAIHAALLNPSALLNRMDAGLSLSDIDAMLSVRQLNELARFNEYVHNLRSTTEIIVFTTGNMGMEKPLKIEVSTTEAKQCREMSEEDRKKFANSPQCQIAQLDLVGMPNCRDGEHPAVKVSVKQTGILGYQALVVYLTPYCARGGEETKQAEGEGEEGLTEENLEE